MIPEVELATALALGYSRHRGRPWSPQARVLLVAAGAGPLLRSIPLARQEIEVPTVGCPSSRRILCADRDGSVAAVLAAALRRAGFDARGCFDGGAALVAVTEFRPHACVFDLETLGIGGCELAQWVRSVLGERVFLIGSADEIEDELDQTAATAGFDLLLPRPADAVLVAGLLAGPAGPK